MKATRHIRSDRSSVEWVIRVALALVVCWLGFLAVCWSLASALPDRAAERAYRLSPGDARLAAEWSRRLLNDRIAAMGDRPFRGKALEQVLIEPEAIARRALRRDAMAVSAITTLGLAAQLRGDIATARARFAYAEQLSRRDLPTELWLIEDAVSRNDIPGALHHYDIALRTRWGSWDLLFPVLANAAGNTDVVPSLVKLLATNPTWAPSFLTFMAEKGTDPPATARLFMALGRTGAPVAEGARASVVDALLTTGDRERAWLYYASALRGADRRRSRDPEFAAILEHPSQLDWRVANSDSGLTASIRRAGQRAVFDFSAPPSVGGALIHQIQLLPPGRYILQGRSIGISQAPASRPYWIVTCTSDARELGRVEVPNSANNKGLFTGLIVVPPNCPAQYLALIARGSDALDGLSGQILHAELRPIT